MEEGNLRLVFQNVELLPKGQNSDKNHWLFDFCLEWKVDIFGMAKVNRRWHRVNPQDHFQDRFRGWWESLHTSVSYNRHNHGAGHFQWGGTALLSVDRVAH